MTTSDDDTVIHPITTHLLHAAEHLRLANHATHSDRREITELYDTFGALHVLLERLPQLLGHLWWLLNRADAILYTTDCGRPAQENLNCAELAMSDALGNLGPIIIAISDAWSDIGHLRLHDTGIDPA